MEIAETITLAMAILLIVGQFLALLTAKSKITEARLALVVWLPMFTLMAVTSEVGGTHRSKLVAMQPLFKGVKKEKPPGFG